jgi:DNA-binding transcriptional LysR family regulator
MLNLLALNALRAFIEGGNLAQAAALVHRTEPQVSRLLTGLQDDMGFPILRKEGRSLVLTPEGQEFYKTVELLLEAVDEVQDFSRENRRQRLHHVNVVAPPHLTGGLLVDAFARIRARNPKFTASVDTGTMRDIESMLGRHQFDVALTQLPMDHPRVEVRPLMKSQVVAVMKSGHPLARHRMVTPEQLRGHALILLPAHSVIRLRCEPVLGKLPRGTCFEMATGPLAAQLAAKGVGVALIDPLAALAQLSSGAVIRPFKPMISLWYGAVVPRGRPVSPATEALLTELSDVVRERTTQLREAADGLDAQ